MIEPKIKKPVGAANFKRTKIVAAIGPPTDSYEMIYAMIEKGVNAITMNFSHQTYDAAKRQTKWIRKASAELGKPVAIVQDLAGPKIRLGDFEGFIGVETGQQIRLGYETNYETTGIIPVQYDLSKKVARGHTMFIYDGKVRTTVQSVKDGVIYARVENNGVLLKRKGINLPDTDFGGDVITEKDKADLAFGSTQDFDYVAMSFVQTAEDLRSIKRIIKNLGSEAKLMVKVETKAAIDIEDNGTVRVFGETKAAAAAAVAKIQALTAEIEPGTIYMGKVIRIVEFGAFVNIMPGTDGLLHISQISNERIANVTDVLSEGQEIKVQVADVDNRGRIKLTMKDIEQA